MDFISFIKDKILQISLMIFSIITIEIFLICYPYGIFMRIYIPVIILGIYFITIFLEYFKKRNYYQGIYGTLDELQEKYLITELISTPNFSEGKILKEIMEEVDKSMIENVNKYKYLTEDYKDYIEMWIHEIKIPIASR